jgi:hypothetical protein
VTIPGCLPFPGRGLRLSWRLDGGEALKGEAIMSPTTLINASKGNRRRAFTDEVLGEPMAAILRTKTPAERLAMALQSWTFLRDLIRRTAALQHPEWSQAELDRHVAGRMLHGAS